MDTTQFAMVEELASLIKDNLYSKHLVLSTEETLIAILQHQYHSYDSDNDDDDNGYRNTIAPYSEADTNIVELQPASSYQRLLLHRLADIYGFAHESVGEGEDRHLVLQRCPETAIPPVLVSDVLWQYDDKDASTSVALTRNDTDLQKTCKREESVQKVISSEGSHLKTDTDLKPLKQLVTLPAASLKEREAAYRAARERIFSTHDDKGKDTSVAKPRHVPAAAQRMIAHALGKKVESPKETAGALVNDKGKEPANGRNIATSSRNSIYPGNRRAVASVSPDDLKREQTGAAKRMFANALRLPGVEGSDSVAARKSR